MTIQELKVTIQQLLTSCEESKQRLTYGENNLNQLIISINHYTGASASGRMATQLTQSTAQRLKEAIISIQELERELSDYLKSIENI